MLLALRNHLPFLLVCMLCTTLRSVWAVETVEEAAYLARSLVQSRESVGTMATVYPKNFHPLLAGTPFSLQEYFSSCFTNGSLTLLLMPISRHGQNIMSSPDHRASISVTTTHPLASGPRVSLMGNVKIFEDIREVPDLETMQECYISKHSDARRWLPGPHEPHIANWATFEPHTIYYVGGFGSEHFIGYIPLDTYQSATPSVGSDHSPLVQQV